MFQHMYNLQFKFSNICDHAPHDCFSAIIWLARPLIVESAGYLNFLFAYTDVYQRVDNSRTVFHRKTGICSKNSWYLEQTKEQNKTYFLLGSLLSEINWERPWKQARPMSLISDATSVDSRPQRTESQHEVHKKGLDFINLNPCV